MSGRIKSVLFLIICLSAYFALITCSGDNPVHSDSPLPEALGWVEQISPIVDKDLVAVDFVNPSLGWIVGEAGTILKTNNGGQNWVIQESGVTSTLMDIEFLDSRNGWAVGFDGTILRTENGGRTWMVQESGTTSRFEEVTFLDNKTGWISGRIPFALLRTSNGGQSWQSDSVPSLRLLSSMTFADEKNGIAIADWSHFVSTEDGGKSWSLLSETHGPYIWDMAFLENNFGLAILSGYGNNVEEDYLGWQDVVYQTTDGGKNWRQVYWGRGSGMFGGKTYIFAQDNAYIISGYGFSIQHSTDAGQSWTTQFYQFGIELYSADFTNPLTGWAVGRKGAILHTTNGGITPTP